MVADPKGALEFIALGIIAGLLVSRLLYLRVRKRRSHPPEENSQMSKEAAALKWSDVADCTTACARRSPRPERHLRPGNSCRNRTTPPSATNCRPISTPRGLDRQLVRSLTAESAWVREHQHLFLIGPTGIGKAWLGRALAQKACRDG